MPEAIFEPSATAGQAFVVTDNLHSSAQFAGIFSSNVIEHMLQPAQE